MNRFYFVRVEFTNSDGQAMYMSFGMATENGLTNGSIKSETVRRRADAVNIDITFFYEFRNQMDYETYWDEKA